MFYDSLQEKFRGSQAEVKKRLEIYQPFIKPIREIFTTARALDLGCGRGEWLDLCQSVGFEVRGVEISSTAAQALRNRGIEVEEVDALQFLENSSSESYALISAFHLVEHLPFPDVVKLLEQALRCLQPGGLLIFETPNPQNIIVGTSNFYLDPTHKNPIPPQLLLFAAEYVGFWRVKDIGLQEPSYIQELEELGIYNIIADTSPDYAIIAQKSGAGDFSDLDGPFDLDCGITINQLSQRYDQYINKRYAKLNKKIEILEEKVNESHQISKELGAAFDLDDGLKMSELAQRIEAKIKFIEKKTDDLNQVSREIDQKFSDFGQWSTDVARRHDKAISSAHMQIIKLQDLINNPSFIHRKARELYWTITRLFGFAYLHDGSNKKSNANTIEEKLLGISDFEGMHHVMETEAADVCFAFNRLLSIRSSLIKNHSRIESAHTKPRLAFVSPFHPLRSGIADYSAELLPALCHYYDIDAIQTYGKEKFSVPNNLCGSFDIKSFEDNVSQYDHIVYHVGNSRYHAHIFPLIKKYPGIIVLHDMYLMDALRFVEHELNISGYVNKNLYSSHGYNALTSNREINVSIDEQAINYPACFEFLQASEGIVLHSYYALSQVEKYFGEKLKRKCVVIPHLRQLPEKFDKMSARKILGLPLDGVIVCAFGFLGESKRNDFLLDAWLRSNSSNNEINHLIYVGDVCDTIYCDNFVKKLEYFKKKNIKITGFVDRKDYQKYLSAADMAVQLRANSQGETSGATLDCMAHGLITIVSDYSSLSELPDNSVIKVPQNITESGLATLIDAVVKTPNNYSGIPIAAQNYVKHELDPLLIAQLYAKSINVFKDQSGPLFSLNSLKSSAELLIKTGASQDQWVEEALKLAASSVLPLPAKRLLVDISAMVRSDIWTGIQRVVRAQVIGLLKQPPEGFRIEPVYLDEINGNWNLKFARLYTCKLLGIASDGLTDEMVSYASGDIYYMPDFYNTGVTQAAANGLYERMRVKGVKINFLIHDILPITMPDMFPEGAAFIHHDWLKATTTAADQLICISRTVSDEVKEWLASQSSSTQPSPKISVLQHGADIAASLPSQANDPENWKNILISCRNRPTFLMVSTIEPRKGYLFALESFDKLWKDGVDINLVIVGKEGWKDLTDDKRRNIPTTINTIKNHPELGRRLFWLENLSDAQLVALYKNCSCLLAASENEGFGLPLIEAAQYQLAILARDIPIFREVLGNFASYFEGGSNQNLVLSIKKWLELYKRGTHIKSTGLPKYTWSENIEKLKYLLLEIRA